MKTRTSLVLYFVIILTSIKLYSQDCFMPPTGSTIYTTTDPIYNPPSIGGFISLGPNLSGSWSQFSATGTASVNFSDNDGRTSTFSVAGIGTVTIENTVTNIFTSDVTTCQQLINVNAFTKTIGSNPPLPSRCPINLTIVLDESESIRDNMSTEIIKEAVVALVSGLLNTGSNLALVEFDTRAERISLNGSNDLQLIDDALLVALTNYLDSDYYPDGDVTNLVGGTNWEDALDKANQVTGTDLVLMITDGRPTFYSTSAGMNGVAGEGLQFDLTALHQAIISANTLKASGKRLFVAGLDFPTDTQPLIDISGSREYFAGQSLEQLLASDFTRVAPSALVPLLTRFGGSCNLESIPTLSEWSIIICGLLLLIISVTAFKQKILSASIKIS